MINRIILIDKLQRKYQFHSDQKDENDMQETNALEKTLVLQMQNSCAKLQVDAVKTINL